MKSEILGRDDGLIYIVARYKSACVRPADFLAKPFVGLPGVATRRSGGDSHVMCVLAFAWRAHPHWPLIAAGHRDDLHARPAQPLARWDRPDHLPAGRALPSGGTWIGVSAPIGRASGRGKGCT